MPWTSVCPAVGLGGQNHRKVWKAALLALGLPCTLRGPWSAKPRDAQGDTQKQERKPAATAHALGTGLAFPWRGVARCK